MNKNERYEPDSGVAGLAEKISHLFLANSAQKAFLCSFSFTVFINSTRESKHAALPTYFMNIMKKYEVRVYKAIFLKPVSIGYFFMNFVEWRTSWKFINTMNGGLL
jgi:hypothetical protein